MKKILTPLLILALLISGSYGVFGYTAKKNFDATMEQISAKIPNHVNIDYKQGFLSSTVELSIKMDGANPNVNLDVGIIASQTIYHGPFIFHTMQNDRPAYIPVQAYTEGYLFYEITGLQIDSELAKDIKEATTTKINAYIPLIGNPTIQFSGEPLRKETDLQGTTLALDWQGFKGSLDMQGSLKDFTYNIMAPGLMITGDGLERFAINSMTLSGTTHSGNFDLGLGNYKASIKDIALNLSAGPKESSDEILLEDLNLNIIVDEQDGLLTISEFLDINSFAFNKKAYGPTNITIHLRNLDARTLSTMNREYIELQKMNVKDPNILQNQLIQMATIHGLTLLSKSPELDVENISLRTAEGRGEIKLKISFNGDGEAVMNPFVLLERLSVEASLGADERFLAVLAKDLLKESICHDVNDVTCDQKAANASNEQLQQLVINKQLILENNRYIAQIIYKDGAAFLNGTEIPLF